MYSTCKLSSSVVPSAYPYTYQAKNPTLLLSSSYLPTTAYEISSVESLHWSTEVTGPLGKNYSPLTYKTWYL